VNASGKVVTEGNNTTCRFFGIAEHNAAAGANLDAVNDIWALVPIKTGTTAGYIGRKVYLYDDEKISATIATRGPVCGVLKKLFTAGLGWIAFGDSELSAIDSGTGFTGIVKATAGVLSAATAGTDYAIPFTLKSVITGAGTTMSSWDSQPVDPTSGAFAVTMPASPANGDTVRIRNIGASVNAVTVTASGGQTIEGAATYVVAGAYFSVEFCYYSVGAIWTCIRQG